MSGWRIEPLARAEPVWREHWAALHRSAFRDHPLLALDFVDGLLRHFPGNGLRVARYEQDGAIRAVALVHSRGLGRWRVYQPSQAPLPLFMDASDDETARRRLNELVARLPAALLIELPSQDPLLTGLDRASLDGRFSSLEYGTTIAVAKGGQTFEEYWSSRKKKLRDNIKRYFRRTEDENIVWRFEALGDGADFASAVADYGRLESAGWKGREGTAIAPDNDQGRFYADYLSAASRRGLARAYRLYFDDKLVAARLAVLGGDMLVFLKTTFDESFAKLAPGRLMLYLVLEEIFRSEPVERIEFYTKANVDMLQWGNEERSIFHVNCYRSPLLRRLHAGVRSFAAGTRSKDSTERSSSSESE